VSTSGLRDIGFDRVTQEDLHYPARVRLPYLGNIITLPGGPSYPNEEPQLPYLDLQSSGLTYGKVIPL